MTDVWKLRVTRISDANSNKKEQQHFIRYSHTTDEKFASSEKRQAIKYSIVYPSRFFSPCFSFSHFLPKKKKTLHPHTYPTKINKKFFVKTYYYNSKSIHWYRKSMHNVKSQKCIEYLRALSEILLNARHPRCEIDLRNIGNSAGNSACRERFNIPDRA